MPTIETVQELRDALEQGPYTWPGGYPVYYVLSDGATLLPSTVAAERDQIEGAIRDHDDSGWRVVGFDVNWADENMMDDHTGEPIPSAYGDD